MAILEEERKAVNAHAMDSYVGVEVQFKSLLKSVKQIKVNVKFSRYRPEQALGGSGRLRLRIFSTFGTMKVVRSSHLRTGRLYPQQFSWYSFLEAESTPGHVVPSVATEKKFPSDTTVDRSRDPPTSSTVP